MLFSSLGYLGQLSAALAAAVAGRPPVDFAFKKKEQEFLGQQELNVTKQQRKLHYSLETAISTTGWPQATFLSRMSIRILIGIP